MKLKKDNPQRNISEKCLLIVAGEASGDLLGESVLNNLTKLYQQKSVRLITWGFGGEGLKHAGMRIERDINELHVIGFWEALKNYRRLKKYLNELVIRIQIEKPDAALLIDYPGFNIRLAKKLSEKKVKTFMLVSPQIWAWHYSRIKKIKKYFSMMFCLYAFETEMYAEENVPAFFCGHPLVDHVNKSKKKFKTAKLKPERRKLVTLLPGSRGSEISRHSDFLIKLSEKIHEKYPDIEFILPTPGKHAARLLKEFKWPNYVTITNKGTHEALYSSYVAIACSGTVTLECGLFGTPFLLIYSTSPLTYFLARRLIELPYIGMLNVLAGKYVTKEFIQNEMRLDLVFNEFEKLYSDRQYRLKMKSDFKQCVKGLGSGRMAEKTSQKLIEII